MDKQENALTPEAFRDLLIRNVENNTEFGSRIWKKLNRSGKIFVSDVTVDLNTWVSETKIIDATSGRKSIHLGTQAIPQAIAEQVFAHQHRSQTESIVYRFTHELAHEIASEANVRSLSFKKLFALAQQMRSQGGGLTGLGNLDFYHKRGHVEQATEDVVELLNMLITGTEYLDSYLDFLSDPGMANKRKALGIASFSDPQVRTMLLHALHDGLNAFLEEK